MKKALSCKILFVLAVLAFSLALAFSFNGVKSVRADDIIFPSSAFSGGQSIVFDEEGNVKATVKSGDTVKISNPLVVDDLAIKLDIPDTVEKYTLNLKYNSYFEIEYPNEIEKNFQRVATGDDVVISLTTVDNVLYLNEEKQADVKVKGGDKCVANISFTFTLKENFESADIKFKSIDQNQSDGTGKYKQTFELKTLEDGTKVIDKLATPRVSINDLPITKDNDGNLNVIYGKYYNFSTIKTYSVFGDGSLGSPYIKSADNWVDSTNVIAFKDKDNSTDVIICAKDGDTEKELETYKALPAKEYDADNTAPTYIEYNDNTKVVYEEYAKLVEKAAKDGDHSILLGESFEIPSLKGLVTDDYDVYSDLKYTVYYRTPSNASGSTSSLNFTISEAGDYEFYVVFKDSNGNAMDREDFYKLDEHDESKIVGIDDIAAAIADPSTVVATYKYFPAVFRFTVQDDAPLSVTAPESQGAGYLNTKYTATAFTIQSSGYNVTYKLYYNANKDADKNGEGWVSIPKLADVTEEYDENDFTYSDIKTIDYDGKYTFTPIKLGAYKIECEISSDKSERSESESTVIKVSEEPSVVKPDTHWLRNNIWSVVFLSVGTLALIGIIVLLFIKPKEEVETDETGDALKIKESK